LWLAFRQVPFDTLGQALSQADYLWLVPAVALHLLAIFVRAVRWQTLLGAREILPETFWAQGVGFLFTNAFPFRMGEPARIVVLSGKTRMPLLRVAASVVVERMLDVATVLGLLALALPWMDVPPLVIQAGQLFAVVLAVGVFGLILLVRLRRWTEATLRGVLNRLRLPADSLLARWDEIVEGVLPLTRPGTALQSVAWSIGVWALYVGFYWFVLRAFRPDPTPVEATFMVVALALAIAVPSSPGFIGVYQLAGQQALSLPFGGRYDPSTALAVTLVSHLAYYLLTSSLGAIGLAKMGATFAELGRTLLRGGIRSKPPRGPHHAEDIPDRLDGTADGPPEGET
jgi:uncharacterized protein (TIRG00374 family)